MLRMELTPNGAPNIAEFGTVANAEHFKVMHAISPYHRVKDGANYPAVIVTTGANDPRVDAWLPGKFAARLQAATGSGKPVLLRVDFDAGHGMGSTKAQWTAEAGRRLVVLPVADGRAGVPAREVTRSRADGRRVRRRARRARAPEVRAAANR